MESYKNPIHFFKIDPERIETLDLREIRRIKKEWLAEIELSDTDFISHQGKSISKNDIIYYSEMLSSETELPFYIEMTRWPQLEKFLTDRNARFFSHNESKKLPEFPFREKLSPFFCSAYNEALARAFHKRSWRTLFFFQKGKQSIPLSWQVKCYRKTMGLVIQERREVHTQLEKRNFMLYAEDSEGPIDWKTAVSLRLLPPHFHHSSTWLLTLRRQWLWLKIKGIFRGILVVLWVFFIGSLIMALLFIFIYYQAKGF